MAIIGTTRRYVCTCAILLGCFLPIAGCQTSDKDSSAPPPTPNNHLVGPMPDGMSGVIDSNRDGAVDGEIIDGTLPAAGAFVDGRSNARVELPFTIDFETPRLNAPNQVINPYVDATTGVRFTSPPQGGHHPVVGLVRDYGTSSCALVDGDQKLASGLGSIVGFSGFDIVGTFPHVLRPPTVFFVEVQAGTNVRGVLRLIDSSGQVVAFATRRVQPPLGTCGFPGLARGRTIVKIWTDRAVARVRIGVNRAGIVFAIDDFSYAFSPALDVIPGACPNILDPVGRGLMSVALLGGASFDVHEVDPATVTLEACVPKRISIGDVSSATGDSGECGCEKGDRDGFDDLCLEFRAQDIVDVLGTVEGVYTLALRGALKDGTPFVSMDCIQLSGPPASTRGGLVRPSD